jgi:hypothetical protein
MLLEFIDGKQLTVNEIFGGPKLVNGVMRDTLRIEISPDTASMEDLKAMFKDQQKCRTLYSIRDDEDEDGNPIQVRNTIGEGYTIFVSISDEERIIKCAPGILVPDTIEEVYIATISQMTYNEYVETFGTPPQS